MNASALLAAAMSFTLTPGPVIIDLPGFNVRDVAPPIFDETHGTWHLYATVINLTRGQPGYLGEVGHFHQTGNVTDPWTYDGIAVPRGEPGEWDETGVFTPGAVRDGDDRWVIFFGGVGAGYLNHTGVDFSEWQGIATASSPFGPFTKSPANPTIRSAIGPPPMSAGRGGALFDSESLSGAACNTTMLPGATNIIGGDITHAQTKDAQACAAWCCGMSECRGFTFTSAQPHGADGCPQGSSCCWLKSAAGPTEPEASCTSGVIQPPPPNGSWRFIRVDNPLPLVTSSGNRVLLMKAVALNGTALLNAYLPQNGSASNPGWDPPYVEREGNPITHPLPTSPDGFENEEVFAGPDGLLHMIGNNHGIPGNPHFVADPKSSLLEWHLLETLHGIGEPAPIARGGIGAASQPPLGFTLFHDNSEGRLIVSFESIHWKEREHDPRQ